MNNGILCFNLVEFRFCVMNNCIGECVKLIWIIMSVWVFGIIFFMFEYVISWYFNLIIR